MRELKSAVDGLYTKVDGLSLLVSAVGQWRIPAVVLCVPERDEEQKGADAPPKGVGAWLKAKCMDAKGKVADKFYVRLRLYFCCECALLPEDVVALLNCTCTNHPSPLHEGLKLSFPKDLLVKALPVLLVGLAYLHTYLHT